MWSAHDEKPDKCIGTFSDKTGYSNIFEDHEAQNHSRNTSDSSEWKLDPQSFQKICQLGGTPETDLFASRLSQKIKTYLP